MEVEQLNACFTGIYEHTLDAKGRVSLPAKIRRDLPATVKTVLSLDKQSVLVFSPTAFKAWYDSFFVGGVNPRSREHQQLAMRLLAYAEDTDVDSAGRIGVSARLRSIVGLDRDVTIVGCGDHLEIVDRARYAQVEADLLAMDFMVD